MRKRPLAYAACVFLAGLAYQRYQTKAVVLMVIGVILWEIYLGWKSKKVRKSAGRSILLLSAFLLGVFHMQSEERFRDAYMSKVIDGSQVTVWGELIKIEPTEFGVRGILTDCYISYIGENIPCNDIMVYFTTEEHQIGQIHKISGQINYFSHARNQGNFDAAIYYQSLKVDFSIKEESCECYQSSSYGIRQSLLVVREAVAEVYRSCMKESPAGFYQAMVLGDKTNLDEVLKQLFTLGGISHILAISGLHVSIIGRGLYRILRKGGIGFWIAGIVAGVLLLLYGAMVGNSTSTVRAVGMLLAFFLSQGMGRSYDMLNALGMMVLLLLGENPFLIENTGFWFSVTALLGVGIVGKALTFGRKKSKMSKLTNGLWMSIGITLATLPVTALSYYEIPLYAPIVNFVVLPLLTPIFVLALLGGMIGSLLPVSGVLVYLLKPCEWLLYFYEWVCEVISRLPGANLLCGKPEWWQVMLYYLTLFIGMHCFMRMKLNSGKGRWILIPILFVCALCVFFPKSHDFEITFLDVGQGDGIYISAGDGNHFFIDGGSSNVNKVGENRILPFLKSKQVSSIDYWFVSHCDTDHISGVLEMLEKGYKVEHIVLYERRSQEENHLLLLEMAYKVGTDVIFMKAGDSVNSKNIMFSCIAPDAKKDEKGEADINESSLVLLMEGKEKYGGDFRALFAGDISTETEEMLCEKELLYDVDLFKANHHGSNYSNGESLLEIIRPECIVVSCSKKNLYGHPGERAIARMESCGARIFYTMDNGQVTFPLIQ